MQPSLVLLYIGVELRPGVVDVYERALPGRGGWRVLGCGHRHDNLLQPWLLLHLVPRLHLQALPLAAAVDPVPPWVALAEPQVTLPMTPVQGEGSLLGSII